MSFKSSSRPRARESSRGKQGDDEKYPYRNKPHRAEEFILPSCLCAAAVRPSVELVKRTALLNKRGACTTRERRFRHYGVKLIKPDYLEGRKNFNTRPFFFSPSGGQPYKRETFYSPLPPQTFFLPFDFLFN